MTIRNSWDRTTRVRWPKAGQALVLLVALGAGVPQLEGQRPRAQAEAGSLEAIAREFRGKAGAPGAAGARAALEAYLLKHPKDSDGALARLALYNGDTTAAGRRGLEAARPLLPAIADYVDWMISSTALAAQDPAGAYEAAERVLQVKGTPLEGRAALAALKAARERGEAEPMMEVLAQHGAALTEAQRLFYAAVAHQMRGETSAAQQKLLKVYVGEARSPEAVEAGKMLQGVALAQQLERAYRLLELGDAGGAKASLHGLLPRLDGAQRELARVRMGVCEYRLRSASAMAALRAAAPETITPQNREADAERLFYLLLAARRAKDYTAMAAAMEALNARHRESPWRLEGLANAAGQYWVMGESAKSLPLYETCAGEFADTAAARHCDWKVAVASQILRRPDAETKMIAYLTRDPAGEHASAALYFLGKSAEQRRDRAAARAWYDKAVEAFPNHFYAELCRERLEAGELGRQAASPAVLAKLRELKFTPPVGELDFRPEAATRRRLERAELLARGAMYEFAELELRHEGRNHPQAHVLALAAARMAVRRGAPEQGIRYVKSIFPSYVNLPLSAVTLPLLKLAYPLPYKDELLTQAFKNDLDPYVVAGLIRQESEFAAGVVSRANAHGLTQIMPATGRELARRLGLRGFTKSMLFDPQTNLTMGTYYFKRLLDSLGGSVAHSLASYNAGKGRVTEWLSRGNLAEDHDPAEFIETIPFDETRNYVQAVIRNAGMYRRIYGSAGAVAMPVATATAPVLKPVTAAPKKAVAKPKKAPAKKSAKKAAQRG